ncbi:conserved hypothetical protein [Candidatus Koribacter versatilis Ellin345]|uniref:RelA/SpoT domain-containing protein n=1 Tax=Koribacter versatilis (strain Ellin345) TaxID=204669 RepID=Q1IUR4_KORVE|nr:RelA/SpoT domain-containing protein [Candidatus Koribacter versatilis]ABF39386.1 conserved hypothetical protein [Candidatus Koribacter versatilis Ellin345]
MANDENSTDRVDVEEVMRQFVEKRDLLEAFRSKTEGLISELLDAAAIRCQSIQSRVKTNKKLRAKYLDPKKDYRSLDEITDQVGFRIIVYYQDEIDVVAKLVRDEFDVDEANSVDKRITDPERFGYQAVHCVCQHSSGRSKITEYKKHAGITCEIQIATILGHAWAEMEHEWYDLQDDFPDDIKRKFSRLAALLDLADSEFLDIRKKKSSYERSVELRIEANVPDVPLDSVSLKSLLTQDPHVKEVDSKLAVIFASELVPDLSDAEARRRFPIMEFLGLQSVRSAQDKLRQHEAALLEFATLSEQGVWRDWKLKTPIMPGIGFYHLMLLFAFSGGLESAQVALAKLGGGLKGYPHLDEQVRIAQAVAKKYGLT